MPAVIARIRHNHTNYDRLRISYRYESGIFEYEDYRVLARDKARQRVSGRITEILYRWETNGGCDFKEILLRNLRCHGESTREEILFRFHQHRENEVQQALNQLLLENKIILNSELYSLPDSITKIEETHEENIGAIAA